MSSIIFEGLRIFTLLAVEGAPDTYLQIDWIDTTYLNKTLKNSNFTRPATFLVLT